MDKPSTDRVEDISIGVGVSFCCMLWHRYENISASPIALSVLLVFIVAGHFWWVYQNWERNREDIKAAFDYFDEVHFLFSTRQLPERKREGARWIIQDAVPTCEVLFTVLLSGVAVYLATG